MKESPILFNTEMVQAILNGRKTQTRRIIKPQPSEFVQEEFGPVAIVGTYKGLKQGKTCPYGYPGDLLWVKEKHAIVNDPYDKPILVYCSADNHKSAIVSKWKSPRFMPKAAARIWLEVINVTIERLQGISEANAKAEGIKYVIDKVTGYCGYDYINGGYNLLTTPHQGFKSLWKSINGVDSWDSNPWLWVITFKVISTTGKPNLNTLTS